MHNPFLSKNPEIFIESNKKIQRAIKTKFLRTVLAETDKGTLAIQISNNSDSITDAQFYLDNVPVSTELNKELLLIFFN